jgi:hypothetical protein
VSLLLPPAVQAEMETRRDARIAEALDRELKAHDPNLGLVWVKTGIPSWEIPEHVIPGRWHVKRENPPPLLPSYMAITREDGGYREPDFGVLMEIKKRDLWHNEIPGPPKDPYKEQGRTLEDEQRVDEMKADYRAARRVAGENVHKRSWAKGKKK